jgi:hypothetical protein
MVALRNNGCLADILCWFLERPPVSFESQQGLKLTLKTSAYG